MDAAEAIHSYPGSWSLQFHGRSILATPKFFLLFWRKLQSVSKVFFMMVWPAMVHSIGLHWLGARGMRNFMSKLANWQQATKQSAQRTAFPCAHIVTQLMILGMWVIHLAGSQRFLEQEYQHDFIFLPLNTMSQNYWYNGFFRQKNIIFIW